MGVQRAVADQPDSTRICGHNATDQTGTFRSQIHGDHVSLFGKKVVRFFWDKYTVLEYISAFDQNVIQNYYIKIPRTKPASQSKMPKVGKNY